MAAELTFDPCPVYDWCIGHEPHETGEDLDLHQGELNPVTVGSSTVRLEVAAEGNGAVTFSLDLDYWSIPSDTLESEFADLLAILNRVEEQAKAFRQKLTSDRQQSALNAQGVKA